MTILTPKTMTAEQVRAAVTKGETCPFVKMSDDEYFGMTDFMSHSTLKKMKDSPSKFKWELDHPPKRSAAMAFGTAVHAALLEPDVFEKTYKVRPKMDMRTKKGKEAAAAWDDENPDCVPLTPDEMDTIVRIHDRVCNDEFYSQFLNGGSKECAFFARYGETRVKCKVDQIVESKGATFLVDVKTTDSANRYIFNNDITKYGYLTQAAYYMDLVEYAWGQRPDAFVNLVVEKVKDCDAQVFFYEDADLALASKVTKQWLTDYAMCSNSNTWPGYTKEFVPYRLPSYLREQWEAQVND